MCLIPGSWRFLEENDNPLQYSCLENLMDRGAWGLQSVGLQRVGNDWETEHAHTYEQQTANIFLNNKWVKTLLFRSRRQGCCISPPLFDIALDVLTKAIVKKKEIIGIQIGKKEVRRSPFADHIILYKIPQDSHTKKNPARANNSVKLQDTKSVHNVQLSFYTPAMNNPKGKSRKQPSLQ